MKIDGITLIQKIRNKEIKENTQIKCSDYIIPYFYKNGTLGFYDTDEDFIELSLKDMLENIDYATYEIIEDKPKVTVEMTEEEYFRYLDIKNIGIKPIEDKEYEDIEE